VNKNKLFIENSVLTMLFLTFLYFAISFTYSFFKDVEVKIPNMDFNLTVPKIDTNILLNNYIDKNESIAKEKKENAKKDAITSPIKTISEVKKKTENTIVNKSLDVNNSKKTNISKADVIKKETIVKIVVKEKTVEKVQIPIVKKTTSQKTSKEEMLKQLGNYIKTTIRAVRTNANTVKDIDKNNLSIKIRVTVLDDGTYQNVKHLSGNKDLMKEVKLAIKKTFPKVQNKIIKSQFPRYLRFKVEFKNEQ